MATKMNDLDLCLEDA